jgi:hypothetical protein
VMRKLDEVALIGMLDHCHDIVVGPSLAPRLARKAKLLKSRIIWASRVRKQSAETVHRS